MSFLYVFSHTFKPYHIPLTPRQAYGEIFRLYDAFHQESLSKSPKNPPVHIDESTHWGAEIVLSYFGDPAGENMAKKIKESYSNGRIPEDIIRKVQYAALCWYQPNKQLSRKELCEIIQSLLEGAPSPALTRKAGENLAMLDTREFMRRCLGTLLNPDTEPATRWSVRHYLQVLTGGIPREAFRKDHLLSQLWIAGFRNVEEAIVPPLALSEREMFNLLGQLDAAEKAYVDSNKSSK